MIVEHKEILKALCDDFDRADKIIQDVKSITTQEVIPAISELRYSGWHLALSLNSYIATGNFDEKNLSEAKSHSKRAIFEASRYGILFCVTTILDFRKMYGGEIMPGIIKDYSEKIMKAEESRIFLVSAASEGEDSRADACYAHFLTVKKILLELISCQPELNEAKELKQKEIEDMKKRYKQTIVITIAVAIIMIAVTVIIAVAE